MVRTAEQHANLATHFDKLADDERFPDRKIAFARRANWHRILCRIAATRGDRVLAVMLPPDRDPESHLFSPMRLWSMRPKKSAFTAPNQELLSDHSH
jgi:hypothetical protein